jgi:hypothetical protein
VLRQEVPTAALWLSGFQEADGQAFRFRLTMFRSGASLRQLQRQRQPQHQRRFLFGQRYCQFDVVAPEQF